MNDFALKIMHSFSEKISIRSVWNTRAKIDTVLLCWVSNSIFEMIVHPVDRNLILEKTRLEQELLAKDNHISERVRRFEWPGVKYYYSSTPIAYVPMLLIKKKIEPKNLRVQKIHAKQYRSYVGGWYRYLLQSNRQN